ncbi:MAG TPA: YicC/YloC family endoribonuclease [Patescibacteria group bacterium]|nr:YicC/YloC family endoribonuclease [Patescibacteria group bacterium]
MLKSMTGFGRGEYIDNDHRFLVEIKAVNHRYNEIVIRMPKSLGTLEDKIRRSVSGTLQRGRIDVFITVDEYSQKKRTVRVDKELAIAYNKALTELSVMLNSPSIDPIYQIARYPDVLKVEEVSEDAELLWVKVEQAVNAAVSNLMNMRMAEGANIEKDLLARMTKLDSQVRLLEDRAPQIITSYREKLLGRMKELLAAVGAEPDELRLIQETALFADRSNFTEELVRLRSHIDQFRISLSTSETVGRKLDFIIQEVNRETNTIASKASDINVANVVVEIKSEMEKVREQIQNIE